MNAAAESDESMMLAYAAGEAAAFTRLYDRHEHAVHRYFLRQLLSPAQADDLLQETWMSIVRSASNYAVDAKFTTWLYTIARNKLIDHWRATRLHRAVLDDAANDPDDDEGSSPLDHLVGSDAMRPDVQAVSRQQAQAFIAAVEALPPAQREIFLLHVEGELSLEDMAVVTAVGTETAKSRLRYAMKRMRLACADWLAPAAAAQAAGDGSAA